MNCINYSSSEYKSLLRDSGLSELELDAAILLYQSNNNTDSYPSLESIKVTKQEPKYIDKVFSTIESMKNQNLIYDNGDLLSGLYLNTFDGVTDELISKVKETAAENDVAFVKDHMATEIFLENKSDRLTRDKRAISGTMFQNIVHRMSNIVPGLEVQGLSNEDYIEFAQKNGIIESFNSPAFIIGDSIFYNAESTMLTKDMAIEEALHPIVFGIQTENPELFKQLFNEAKEFYPELWSDIKDSYKSNHSNELVTQALSREFSNIDNNRMSNNVILRALETLKSFLNRLFNYTSKSVTDSPKMALRAIVEDLNTKSNKLTPSFDFNSSYLHTLSPRRNNRPYPNLINNKTYQDFVNKKANDLRTALEVRHKTIRRGIKSNASVVRNINKLIRDTSDDRLDTELRRSNVDILQMSQQHLDLLKGEMIISKFLDTMYGREDSNGRFIPGDITVMNDKLSTIVDRVSEGKDTTLTLEELDDLKINFIDWYDQSQENLKGAFESTSDFFVRYSNYVDIVTGQKTEGDARAKHIYYEKFKNLTNKFEGVKAKYNMLRVELLEREIRKELIDQGASTSIINGIIDEITNPGKDVGQLYLSFGSVNYAKDSMLRLMGYYVTEAKQQVDTEVHKHMQEVGIVLDKIAKRRGGAKLIYNMDQLFSEYIVDDNKPEFNNKNKRLSKSGNWITDLNRGQAYINYQKDINILLKKFGLTQRNEIDVLLYDDRVKFLKEENRIKDKHYERPFVADYYDALVEIIPEAIDAKADIDELITNMLESVTIDGVIHTERFNYTQAESYENLLKQKRNLANIFDENGEEKTGVDREIAESLTKFNNRIQELNDQRHKAEISEWRQTYNKLIEDYDNAVKSGNEDDKRKTGSALRSWKQSNVRTTYKQAFWDRLSQIASAEYGAEYDELQTKRSALLRLYRNTFNLEVSVGDSSMNSKTTITGLSNKQAMSNELKDKIQFIDKRLSEIRKSSTKKSRAGLRFEHVASIETSAEYNAIESRLSGTPEYKTWFDANHYTVTGKYGITQSVPYSYWTVLTPVDNTLIKEEPSNLWNDASPSSGLSNPEFNRDQAEQGMIPKRSLYDNSTNFNKIKNDPELFELYTLLRDIMKSSQDLLGDMNVGSSLTLPQQTGIFGTRFKSEFSKGRNFGRFKAFFKGIQAIYRDWFVIDSDDTFFNVQDEEEVKDIAKFQTDRSNRFIPTYFNRRLDNTDMLSKNLIGSVLEYSRMANNYREMYKILPKLNLINEQISERSIAQNGGNGTKSGANSLISQKANSFLKDQVFNKRNPYSFNGGKIANALLGNPKDGRPIKVAVGKPIMMLRNYIVSVNLAFKPIAIIADYVTAQFDIWTEFAVGRYFDPATLGRSKIELMKSVIPWLTQAGHNKKTNKLVSLMMFNEMSFSRQNQTSDYHLMGKGVSKWRALKQNFMFWGWNTSDYIVKAQATAGIYMNHKLVNGIIMDKQGFMRKYKFNSKKDANTAWSLQGKTLYDAISIDPKTGKFSFSDKAFEKAYNNNTEAYIKGLLHKVMSEIDGQIRETDKSSIHNNVFGSFLTMHRGFILANMYKQFRPRSYDFFTRREEYGNYRGAWNFIMNKEGSREDRASIDGFRYTAMALSAWFMMIVISNILLSLSDEDKDDVNLQYTAHQVSRIQFEMASKFSPGDLMSLVNNPTAALGFIDNIKDIGKWFREGEVKSGIYKGMPYWQQQLYKITPYKNIYETMSADPAMYRNRQSLLYKGTFLDVYKLFQDDETPTNRETSSGR